MSENGCFDPIVANIGVISFYQPCLYRPIPLLSLSPLSSSRNKSSRISSRRSQERNTRWLSLFQETRYCIAMKLGISWSITSHRESRGKSWTRPITWVYTNSITPQPRDKKIIINNYSKSFSIQKITFLSICLRL